MRHKNIIAFGISIVILISSACSTGSSAPSTAKPTSPSAPKVIESASESCSSLEPGARYGAVCSDASIVQGNSENACLDHGGISAWLACPASTTSGQQQSTAPIADATFTPAPSPTESIEPAVPTAAGASRVNPLPLGSGVVFDQWAVTITQVIRGAEAAQAIAAANQFNDPPRDGYEYLLITLQLQNVSAEQEAQSVSFGVDVRITGDRNVLYGGASVVEPKQLEGELFPGGTVEGQQAFEVPLGEMNLMLRVQESFDFTGKTTRYVALNQGATAFPDPILRSLVPTEVGKTRAQPAKLGEMVRTQHWEAKVLEILRGDAAAAAVQKANQFNEPASSEQEYIAVHVWVRYLGSADPDAAGAVSGSFLKITGEKNVVYESPSVVAPGPDLDVTLYAGGETDGWEVLSVGTGEQGLLVIFEPLFSFSRDEVRYIAAQ